MKQKKSFTPNPWLLPALAVTFIIFTTIILVAFAQGYRVNISGNKIEKTGLVLINSEPSNAIVSINNVATSKKTPFRYTDAPLGSIVVALKKPGYRNWMTKSDVKPSEVTFLNYALLLPTILEQKQLTQSQLYGQVLQAETSPRVVALSKDKQGIYTVSGNGESKIIYRTFSAQPSQLALMQLSADGSRLLFNETTANGTTSLLVINTSNGQAQNLTSTFQLALNNVQFNPDNLSELFWLDAGAVKKLQLNNSTVSKALVVDVASLSLSTRRMLAIKAPSTQNPLEQQLISYGLDGQDQKLIRSLPVDPAGFQTTFIQSRYNEYIAILSLGSQAFSLIKDPYNENLTFKQITKVTTYSINPNHRFIALSADSSLRTLDLEFDRDIATSNSLKGLTQWSWYDTYHLLILQDSQARLIDYDGQNNQLLTPTADVAGVYGVKDKKAVFPLNNEGHLFELLLTKK